MFDEFVGRVFGAIATLMGLAAIIGGAWVAWQSHELGYLGACLLGVFFLLHGLARLFPGEPPPMPIEPGDPTMQAAIEQARREFRRFEAGLAEGRREALIKYPMHTGVGESEHVWALAHSIADGEVVCSLASEPVGDSKDSTGRQRVAKRDIEDWILIDADGRIEGGFTQIAMAKIYKREHGFVPYAIRKGLPNFADLKDPTLAG